MVIYFYFINMKVTELQLFSIYVILLLYIMYLIPKLIIPEPKQLQLNETICTIFANNFCPSLYKYSRLKDGILSNISQSRRQYEQAQM